MVGADVVVRDHHQLLLSDVGHQGLQHRPNITERLQSYRNSCDIARNRNLKVEHDARL